VAVKQSKRKNGSQWSPRLAGLLLCAFFVLGMMTGFSAPGRAMLARAALALKHWKALALQKVAPLGAIAGYLGQDIVPARFARPIERAKLRVAADGAARFLPVALVERSDGFYTLSAEQGLIGPVSPAAQPDIPILSGAGVQNASPAELVRYAAILVRAEAGLSKLISEMNVSSDGTAALFLDRVPTEIRIDIGREPVEIGRAAEVLNRWQGRETLIAMVDMTTPGLAVLRFKTNLTHLAPHGNVTRARVASSAPRRRIVDAERVREPLIR
jgi:hypothetical protein